MAQRDGGSGDKRRGAVGADSNGDLPRAMAFVQRLGALDVADLEAVGRAWRTVVADGPADWFAAEGAVGRAVRQTQRQSEQELLLEALVDVVRRRGWWRLDHIAGADGRGLT